LAFQQDEGVGAQTILIKSVTLPLDNVQVEGIQSTVYKNDSVALELSPNPFNPSVTISLHGNASMQNARIEIYDMSGALVETLRTNKNGMAQWIASGRPSAVYIVKAVVSGKVLQKKALLLK